MNRISIGGGLVLAALLLALPARAWVYPEHRAITGTAVETLDPARRRALERLWGEARKGHEERLCATPWAGVQGTKPPCIDYAAWPALAGDHSCSADDLRRAVLEKPWALDVARVAAVLEKGLATARNPNEARNRLTKSDLDLERADREYSSRAGANNVHFLLARDTDDVVEYLTASVRTGAELNGLGVWARYHLAAMRLAAELEAGRVPVDRRPEVALAALAAEAFGDHFLEDAFASGHVAGTWGDVATRKGTHDYYNENGLAVNGWNGKPMLLYGDARMRPADRERGGVAVRASLEQFLDAGTADGSASADPSSVPIDWAGAVGSFDTCQTLEMPAPPEIARPLVESIAKILFTTPVPGRKPPEGPLPRFRAEIGPFLGLAAGLAGGAAGSGFESTVAGSRATGSMDVGVRAGVGLEALLGDAGDGQIFLQAGFLQETGQKDACPEGCDTGTVQQIALRPPARKAITLRLRLPFWLIPGDLVVAAPLLVPLAPQFYKKMAIQAVNGGAIPWQTGLATFLGRVQFVAGREVGVSFFGFSGGEDQMFVSGTGSSAGGVTAIALRSIRFDFPLVEVRPFRGFATTQAAAVLIQIGMAFDTPTKVTVLWPEGAAVPDLKTSWSVYFRVAFDWRRYL